MGLFGRKQQETTEQIEALRAELAALRVRLDTTDAAKTRLEENIGALHAENGRLRDELLVQITTATSAANDATRSLAEQTAVHIDEQRARLADLAVVATDAAERATSAAEQSDSVDERLATAERRAADAAERAATVEQQSADATDRTAAIERQTSDTAERIASIEQQAADARDRAAAIEQRAVDAEERVASVEQRAADAEERIDTVDARLTQVATELANQLTELSNDLESVGAATPAVDTDAVFAAQSLGLDAELVEELIDAQERLANEQARYQIAFRQDLAELADRLRRQR